MGSNLVSGRSELPAKCRFRQYRLATGLYLERFGDDCVLLVAERDLLLAINAAAADLFEWLSAESSALNFTVEGIAGGLSRDFDLAPAVCLEKSRELLAFGLKHRLITRAASERPALSTEGHS